MHSAAMAREAEPPHWSATAAAAVAVILLTHNPQAPVAQSPWIINLYMISAVATLFKEFR